MMKIWLIEPAEPLPFEPGARLMRTGQLAQALATAGHQVVWWTSNFDHARKRFRCRGSQTVVMGPNYVIELLRSIGYRSNVSVTRLMSQIALGREFGRLALLRDEPDIVLTALPTLELCRAAIGYGQRTGIPVVVDILDIWPETYLNIVPERLRRFIRPLLATEFRRASQICGQAEALFAVSNGYLNWALQLAGREPRPSDAVFLLGYDPDIPDPSPEDQFWLDGLGIRAEHCVACFIGMFGTAYDVATVIAAARVLHSRGDRLIRFVIAGDGPHARKWKALARGLPNVVFTGWLTQNRIHALLRRANVGLAAYYAPRATQSLPYKPFEYMAGGVAMLSSLPGELEELLAREGVGLTYPAGDAPRLTDLLDRLAREPDTAKSMGERARSLAVHHFSTAVITSRMIRRLEQIAAPPVTNTTSSAAELAARDCESPA